MRYLSLQIDFSENYSFKYGNEVTYKAFILEAVGTR